MATNNQLTHAQSYKLAKWVETTAKENVYATHQELADKATQALGFQVSKSNASYAREMTGVDWTGRRGPYMQKNGNKTRDRIATVAKEVIRLQESVNDIRRQLGLPIELPKQDLSSIAFHTAIKKETQLDLKNFVFRG